MKLKIIERGIPFNKHIPYARVYLENNEVVLLNKITDFYGCIDIPDKMIERLHVTNSILRIRKFDNNHYCMKPFESIGAGIPKIFTDENHHGRRKGVIEMVRDLPYSIKYHLN